MRTKELLSKNVINRDEKIAQLKKMDLWREYLKEVKREDERYLILTRSLDTWLNSSVSWKDFLYGSFLFACTTKGFDFWAHVANYGERPDRPRRVNK